MASGLPGRDSNDDKLRAAENRSYCQIGSRWGYAFGTVVAGLGTFHASLAVGGVAATLQATSSALVTGGAAVVDASVGAAAGAACSS